MRLSTAAFTGIATGLATGLATIIIGFMYLENRTIDKELKEAKIKIENLENKMKEFNK